MKTRLKKVLMGVAYAVSWAIIGFAGIVVLFVGSRVFVYDQFIIPSSSMAPTLIPGDRILVDKLIFGARIYTNYDFAEGQPLESWRMPRLRRIRPNDVMVFNATRGYGRAKTEFKINYVFAKRCVGTPGDTVRVENGFYRNSRYEGTIGLASQQRRLAATPDEYISDNTFRAAHFDESWTIKEFGPLYVPAAGDTIRLTQATCRRYREPIEYETGLELAVRDGRFYLGGAPVAEYVFRENYYFMGGDNVSDSADSRYWGFVPEEFVIGVARRISYSRDRSTGEFRWDRLWRRIDKDLKRDDAGGRTS